MENALEIDNTGGTASPNMPQTGHLQKRHTYKTWSPGDLATLWAHPDMGSAELAALMGRTAESVRCARKRHGRFSHSGAGADAALCVVCDERVVWEESDQAAAMRLCKGCYLREMRQRKAEDRMSGALRQARYKYRQKRLRNRGKK